MTATITEAPAAPVAERVLRVSQVAEHLDCEDGTVYRLINDGHLRAIRVGRLLRVPQSALARSSPGTAPPEPSGAVR